MVIQKNLEIVVPLKYLSNFWRTLEMPLISCGMYLILTWFEDCVVYSANGNEKFEIQRFEIQQIQSIMFQL